MSGFCSLSLSICRMRGLTCPALVTAATTHVAELRCPAPVTYPMGFEASVKKEFIVSH